GNSCQYAWVDGNVIGTWVFNASPSNFYDNVASFYALYYRSGIDDYLNAARTLADGFWELILDSGGNFRYGEQFSTFPRNMSILGMYLRAMDGRSDMYAGLETIANFAYNNDLAWINANGNWTSVQGPYDDFREESYSYAHIAYCGKFDPNSTN